MTAGWTEDRVGALKKLWLEGQSASQIAKQLGGGVTRNAVIGKVHRLGLSGRATPSQPARATFRPSRPRPAARRPRPPRRRAASRPSSPAPDLPSADARARMPDLPGTATVMTLGAHMCKWPIGDPSVDRVQLLRPPRLGRRLLRRTRPRRLPAARSEEERLHRTGPHAAPLHLRALRSARRSLLERERDFCIQALSRRRRCTPELSRWLLESRLRLAGSAAPARTGRGCGYPG